MSCYVKAVITLLSLQWLCSSLLCGRSRAAGTESERTWTIFSLSMNVFMFWLEIFVVVSGRFWQQTCTLLTFKTRQHGANQQQNTCTSRNLGTCPKGLAGFQGEQWLAEVSFKPHPCELTSEQRFFNAALAGSWLGHHRDLMTSS